MSKSNVITFDYIRNTLRSCANSLIMYFYYSFFHVILIYNLVNLSIFNIFQILHQQDIVMTPAQNQIQDELQRKHEELQQLIVHQQEELRRVSEQLFIARYGILTPLLNVRISFEMINFAISFFIYCFLNIHLLYKY